MNSNEKQVPAIVVKRLPRYYRYLSELLKTDIKRISSGALSRKMNVTASQIRQDFNYFGGFGQQGYGYNVEYLHKAIGEILGLDRGNKTIIVGAGNLGRALANHDAFERRGFIITALFDIDSSVVGTRVNGKPVFHMEELDDYLSRERTDIAILTVPRAKTQEIADRLIRSGVRGFLNFSYTELKTDGMVAVENVHLSDALMTLSYKVKRMDS
ncbi:MAG: redox-sensing transcriptional repressor Rex [Clostridia bacterium]|nr:redox-sensing transcriptional repressor Rex [Clostridia bacterium]